MMLLMLVLLRVRVVFMRQHKPAIVKSWETFKILLYASAMRNPLGCQTPQEMLAALCLQSFHLRANQWDF